MLSLVVVDTKLDTKSTYQFGFIAQTPLYQLTVSLSSKSNLLVALVPMGADIVISLARLPIRQI